MYFDLLQALTKSSSVITQGSHLFETQFMHPRSPIAAGPLTPTPLHASTPTTLNISVSFTSRSECLRLSLFNVKLSPNRYCQGGRGRLYLTLHCQIYGGRRRGRLYLTLHCQIQGGRGRGRRYLTLHHNYSALKQALTRAVLMLR